MITTITIRNWQSLRQVDLALGRLTVIVGPSSSGKTGLMRALRAVASNVRGSANITRGEKATSISVHLDDGTVVTLERSPEAGAYRILHPNGTEETFTKLGGSVPASVTTALGITPSTGGQSLHFAGQFDRPYLLDDTGAAVARELGELTNVHQLLAAVREANRRRATLATLHKTRTADLSAIRAQADRFAALPGKLAALTAAEARATTARHLDHRVSRLRGALETLRIAEQVATRATPPPLPDATRMNAAHNRLHQARQLLHTLTRTTQAAASATRALEAASAAEAAAHTALHETLLAAGTCPTCQQPVTARQ